MVFTKMVLAPFLYESDGQHWRVLSSRAVNEWITEFLPNVIEDRGWLVLTENEFLMLALKFGLGDNM